MKQVTIEVRGFVTATVPDDWKETDLDAVPVKLDAYDSCEHDDSKVDIVNETEIIEKKVVNVVEGI